MFNSKFSRRQFLKSVAAASALTGLGGLSNIAFASSGQASHTVINVSLRGGMDSLSAIVPYTEQAYFDARPTIAIPEAGRTPLNKQFALHAALSPLLPFYNQGDLALVVATGLGAASSTRSHFAARRRMAAGTDNKSQADGWLGRYLSADTHSSAIFRGVGMPGVQKSLQGYDTALGFSSLNAFNIVNTNSLNTDRVPETLRNLYQGKGHPLLESGAAQTFSALDVAASNALGTTVKPDVYGDSKFGATMHQLAEILKADIGLEAVNVDLNGWDFHREMGSWNDGEQALKFDELATGLAAFYNDIASLQGKVTIVVMSEFGRRVQENHSGGTDHGKGGAMMILGGGVAGGQIYGEWPGLSPDNLSRGDLEITTDYRQVLTELLDKRLGRVDLLSNTFPDYVADEYLGIFA